MSQKNPNTIQDIGSIQAAKELKGDGQWTLAQSIMQEIVAGHTMKDPDKIPAVVKLRDQLLEEIETRYKDHDYLQLFLDSVPATRNVYRWFKKDSWEEAVWSKIRVDGLFTKENRAAVIEALRIRAMNKSDSAAKLWLTMSGDYADKLDVNSDKTVDAFREINQALYKKKDTE